MVFHEFKDTDNADWATKSLNYRKIAPVNSFYDRSINELTNYKKNEK